MYILDKQVYPHLRRGHNISATAMQADAGIDSESIYVRPRTIILTFNYVVIIVNPPLLTAMLHAYSNTKETTWGSK